MDFGQAIAALKDGKKVARDGWNGKGMFLVLAGGYSVARANLRPDSHINAEFLESRGLTEMVILPHIDMWTAQNTYLPGWSASRSDILASDWHIVL
ncbi:MAG: DUF2829 domain-containing protein [Betaproteobacteria bacterium]